MQINKKKLRNKKYATDTNTVQQNVTSSSTASSQFTSAITIHRLVNAKTRNVT